MSKISNTSAYPIETPESTDLFIFTDISDLKSTKNARLSTMTTTIKESFYILEDVELQGTTAVKIKTLTFPEGTTIVGNSFSDSEFTSVTFPDTLITIQDNSFYNNKLKSITIPDSTTSIGNEAFSNNLLETVVIGDGVTTIGESAFNNNANLSSVTLGSSVQSIGDAAFYDASIASITFPDSLLTIGGGAFRLNSLTSVTIPNNVTSLGNNAFDGNNISSLTLGSSLQTIGISTFQGNELTSVVIPDSVTEIGRESFSYNLLTSVDLGSGVQYIRNSAFAGDAGITTNQITSITIPDSTIEIEAGAFSRNAISSLTLGSGLTTIGSNAFSYNDIPTLSIPSSVTSIGGSAFIGQSVDITSLTFAQGTGLTIVGGAFSDGGFNLTSLSIPNNTISGGVNFRGGSQIGALTIGDGCTIGAEDFSTSIMTTVNIGNNATIGAGAFDGAQMTSLTVGDNCSLTSPALSGQPTIGSFNGVTVGDIVFGDNLTTDTIAEGEFEYGPFSDSNGSAAMSITGTFTAGDNINFGRRAWFYETNITTSIPSAVTFGPNFTNGDYAFFGAFSLSSFTFTGSPANTVPNGVTIPAFMFTSVHGVTSLTIGDNVTIDYAAFSDNVFVTSLTLGNNVTLTNNGNPSSYSSDTGQNFNWLGSDGSGITLVIPGTTTLVRGAFQDAKIIDLTIQSGLTEIPIQCFEGNSITSLSIASTVLTFGNGCFADQTLPGLTTLTLGSAGNPVTVGNTAFFSAVDLTTVNLPTGSTYVSTGTPSFPAGATINFY